MSDVETDVKDRMDSYFALFNCHVNNAYDRAYEELSKQFPTWADEVKELEEDGGGIMVIFEKSPSPSTAAFVALVTYFVNENRGGNDV